jgi:hypothetical protein
MASTSDINSSGSSDDNAAAGAGSNMTYARALTDARTLIVQQSARIKSDAQKIKAHSDEIAQLRMSIDGMAAEFHRLRALEARLGEAIAGREQAESLVGRQRMEIDSLETASRELQRMVRDQASRIDEMTTQIEELRAHLPTDEDAAALEQMAALLSAARAKARPGRAEVSMSVAHEPAEQLSGPALANQWRDHQVTEARERQQRAARQSQAGRAITIPAEPTPFCIVSERKAA